MRASPSISRRRPSPGPTAASSNSRSIRSASIACSNGLDEIGLTVQKEQDDRRVRGQEPRAQPWLWAQSDDELPNKKLLILPGDGIGPEVMRQVDRVIEWFDRKRIARFDVERRTGRRLRLRRRGHAAHRRDHGARAGRRRGAVRRGRRAEMGQPALRRCGPSAGCCGCARRWSLFANLRPALVFEPLVGASTLKPEVIDGLDIMILRELTGGVYFGEPRGIETLPDGAAPRRQHPGLHHVGDRARRPRRLRAGAQAAQQGLLGRKGQCHGIGRAVARGNAEAARRRITRTSSSSHMYADNCAMQLVRNPKQFDVIVTDNLFGDILSDCAAMLTGSLGMLPSASLGAAGCERPAQGALRAGAWLGARHRRQGHGQPARLRSSRFAMMLRYSFDMTDEADMVEQAVRRRARRRRAHQRHHAARHRARLDHGDGRHVAARARQARLNVAEAFPAPFAD